LNKLQSLYIENNQIDVFPVEALRGLSGLKVITLDRYVQNDDEIQRVVGKNVVLGYP